MQQYYLNLGYRVVQDSGASFTRHEHNGCANYLNENSILWVEYTDAIRQHVNNLDTQRTLDSIDITRNGCIRRTSLVQDYSNISSDSSDSE